MSDPKDSTTKSLVYVTGQGLGAGHVLSCLAVLKHYAEKTGRQFHIVCNNWLMALNSRADIDPFLETFFKKETLADRRTNFSFNQVQSMIADAQERQDSFLIVGAGVIGTERIRRHLGEHSFIDSAAFIEMNDFKELLPKHHACEHDHIIVDAEPPYQSHGPNAKPFDFLRDIPPFAPLDFPYPQRTMDFDHHVGLHIRHGNGEFLHGRAGGDSDEFMTLVERVVNKAKSIAHEHSIDMLAFSDSFQLLEFLEHEYGIGNLGPDYLPDKAFQKHLKSNMGTGRKWHIVATALRDIDCLSKCSHVVCASSLFTQAAYIHSKHKRFTHINL